MPSMSDQQDGVEPKICSKLDSTSGKATRYCKSLFCNSKIPSSADKIEFRIQLAFLDEASETAITSPMIPILVLSILYNAPVIRKEIIIDHNNPDILGSLKGMRTEYLLAFAFCAITVILPLLASAAVSQDVQIESNDVGAWKPIEKVDDPNMVELAKFAVRKFNRAFEQKVDYKSIVKGEKQITEGTNYKLLVEVKDDKTAKKYDFVVWEKPDKYATKHISSIKLMT